MKILLINSYYYPDHVGGAEKSCQLLAEEFRNEGNSVMVFTSKHSIEDEVNGIKIYRSDCGKFDVDARINGCGSFFKKMKNKLIETNNKKVGEELRLVIYKFKPDVIFVNNLYVLSSIVWKVPKNIPIVQTVRDYWFFNGFSYNSKNFLFKHYHRLLFSIRSKFVRCVVAPSESTMSIIRKNKTYLKTLISKLFPTESILMF